MVGPRAISSSDEESEKPNKSTLISSVSSVQTSKILDEILEHNEVMKFDVTKLKTAETLFEDDITEDDEIWMVQAPSDVDINSINAFSLDFESSVSEFKCKTNKKKKQYYSYTTKSPYYCVHFALPSKKTKSFHLSTYPLSGKMILQEDTRIMRKVEDVIYSQSTSEETVMPVTSKMKTEEIHEPLKKSGKKKKSTSFITKA